MTTAEARRHDLYNVLTTTIGVEETETLMAYLPTQPHETLATKADLASLADRMDRVEVGLDSVRTEVTAFRSDIGERIDSVNRRLDRLFLTLAAGLVAVVGTVVVQAIQ